MEQDIAQKLFAMHMEMAMGYEEMAAQCCEKGAVYEVWRAVTAANAERNKARKLRVLYGIGQ